MMALPDEGLNLPPGHSPPPASRDSRRLISRLFWGWDLRYPHEVPKVLERCGLTNIESQRHRIPVGRRWGADIQSREQGELLKRIVMDLADAMLLKHEAIGMSSEEAANSTPRAQGQPIDHGRHPLWMWWVSTIAQKPPAR